MSTWQDYLMNEDPVGNPTVSLPKDNEKKGEDNGQGSEAAGALSEDDTDSGMKTVPAGEDEITKEKSTQFDDFFKMFNKEDKEEDEEDDKTDDDKEDEKASKEVEDLLNWFDKDDDEDEDKEDDKKSDDDKEDDEDKELKNILNWFDEDAPGNPTVNLPKDNEKKGEDNGQGSEAAGALSEDDTDPGMKTNPAGQDEITKEKSTQFDDFFKMFNKKDDEEDANDDQGSDDDDASKSAPLKGEPEDDEKKDEGKDEKIEDFSSFFLGNDVVKPSGLPKGNSAEPAKPVDGNGNSVDPIGDPDLPSNLTEPVKLPVASKPGQDGELKNMFGDDVDPRFFYGNF